MAIAPVGLSTAEALRVPKVIGVAAVDTEDGDAAVAAARAIGARPTPTHASSRSPSRWRRGVGNGGSRAGDPWRPAGG